MAQARFGFYEGSTSGQTSIALRDDEDGASSGYGVVAVWRYGVVGFAAQSSWCTIWCTPKLQTVTLGSNQSESENARNAKKTNLDSALLHSMAIAWFTLCKQGVRGSNGVHPGPDACIASPSVTRENVKGAMLRFRFEPTQVGGLEDTHQRSFYSLRSLHIRGPDVFHRRTDGPVPERLLDEGQIDVAGH